MPAILKSPLVRVVLGAFLVFVVFTTWRFCAHLHKPLGGERTTILRVQRGATLKPVLDQLSAEGVLSRPRWLYLYARLSGATDVRTGTYEMSATQTPVEMLALLMEGRVLLESFTLPEGLNRWQVREFLAEQEWIRPEVFDALCNDGGFLSKQDIPGPSCDGYLFPETYTFARGVAPRKIFEEMFATFNRAFDDVSKNGQGPLKLDKLGLATLASIVEKETGAAEERPRIACVFYNRLRAKPQWRLDTDPTVIYAARLADPKFDGNLKRSHLRRLDSPYNTYRVTGLPPGPIAGAGRAALEAVIQPADCKDFFFVSMNNGRHLFCPTLDCHNAAVQKWQIDYFRGPKK